MKDITSQAKGVVIIALPSRFLRALHTDRPADDRAEKMGLYGFLVGSWQMDTVLHMDDGTTRRDRGEIHAGWVLEGRALQDVWIIPGAFYGTTVRVYDPSRDAWHILWNDPVMQFYPRMIGRARGTDIVQIGAGDNGATLRWSFREITRETFTWQAERSFDGGETWQLQAEFHARRAEEQRLKGDEDSQRRRGGAEDRKEKVR